MYNYTLEESYIITFIIVVVIFIVLVKSTMFIARYFKTHKLLPVVVVGSAVSLVSGGAPPKRTIATGEPQNEIKEHPQNKIKNIKEHPQSKFETSVRDIFGNIAKGTINAADAEEGMDNTEGLYVPHNKKYKFYTMYPSWLRWKGKELEIDGYNVWLGLAFEAQGPQHTEFDKKIDSSYKLYYNRLCNDAAKRKLTKEYGVGLVIVDYKIPKYLLSDYIKSRIYDLCASPEMHPKLRCDRLVPISTHKPTGYIDAFPYKPYRDFEKEKKLGLNALDKNNELL